MSIRAEPGSRLQFTDIILSDVAGVGKVEMYGPWVLPNFLKTRPSNDNIGRFYVTADFEGRPDRVAESIYGSSQLEWVIIAFNNALDVLNWPTAGLIIEYPLSNVVFSELN